MYTPNKHIDTYFIRGFQHHDGALVLSKLKPGKKLDLVPEYDNPYDPNAVRIEYKGTMIGWVPKEKNGLLSLLSYYGHKDVFECRVLQVNKKADPWEQVRVGIYMKDARKKTKR